MRPFRPGPVAGPLLAILAASPDGLTIAALTAALGRPPEDRTAVDQAIRGLDRRGYVRVLTRQPRHGAYAAVWGITTAGRAALAEFEEVVAS